MTVSRDPAGRWFVVLHADVAGPEPLPVSGESVGVDLGLKDFAVLSTGEHIPRPRHMERHERRLKRYQRRLARCQKGSANRQKAKAKVARQHARVADARRDFLHKTSTDLVRRFDGIAVEDLAVRNMVRNRSLAKAISRTGWAEFRAFLAYKAERNGRELAAVDRWYPSSQTCSSCGHLLASLSLGTRSWVCPGCGVLHQRDVNLASDAESPTYTWYRPAVWLQPPPVALAPGAEVSNHEMSAGVTVNCTRLDCPGARFTRWKPLSCRGGSPAAAGSVRYSWATSAPDRLPVLVTVADTCTSWVPLTTGLTRRLL